ncbi:MAG: gamma-aminobutyraldehyde dehydrogenase [Actinobacteria bacterium]|nr:gamma-aminobutyraldehyde dehydrogenase [Actinomycetota bacterium]
MLEERAANCDGGEGGAHTAGSDDEDSHGSAVLPERGLGCPRITVPALYAHAGFGERRSAVSVSVTQVKQFIGGEWMDSSSGETMEVLNPATGEVIAEVPAATAKDVEKAVEAAKKAWSEWRSKTPKDRMELLLALADVIDENAEELARLESQNVGKPWWVAKDEPPAMSDNLRFFAGAARNLEGKSAAEYVEGYTSMLRREPLGIVAGICPWNYPLYMAMWKIGPALAAGNVQIMKPAEQTPMTLLRFAELAQEVIPPGVLQVVTGEGIPAGDALVRHPDIRLVSLTGDTATGKIIAKNAADTVKRLHLELGGKAPMVVLDDADPDTVAEAIKIGGFFNSGQDCTASSRILVSDGIYDDVLSKTVGAVDSMTVGDPASDDEIEMGPVISQEQQQRVLGFLERATDAKATIVTGGGTVGERGFFISPTIVTDVAQDADIVQNEVFGPVVTVQPFSSDEDAIAMANGVRYGLAASVFSENVGRAMKVAAQLDFGTVWINEHLFPLTPEMPHGGFKESGYGKDMSLYSMEEYTRIKHVVVKLAQ